jgi:hypothetical protein
MATTKKVTELTAANSAANTDLLYVVTDPEGVPASKQITLKNFFKGVIYVGDAPASNSATGTKGQFVANGAYLYICTATNSWVRVDLTTSW